MPTLSGSCRLGVDFIVKLLALLKKLLQLLFPPPSLPSRRRHKAVKIKKNSAGAALRPEPRPKKTRQGSGQHSKPAHNRKKSVGQGK